VTIFLQSKQNDILKSILSGLSLVPFLKEYFGP
jgi:hypothetical protein